MYRGQICNLEENPICFDVVFGTFRLTPNNRFAVATATETRGFFQRKLHLGNRGKIPQGFISRGKCRGNSGRKKKSRSKFQTFSPRKKWKIRKNRLWVSKISFLNKKSSISPQASHPWNQLQWSRFHFEMFVGDFGSGHKLRWENCLASQSDRKWAISWSSVEYLPILSQLFAGKKVVEISRKISRGNWKHLETSTRFTEILFVVRTWWNPLWFDIYQTWKKNLLIVGINYLRRSSATGKLQ